MYTSAKPYFYGTGRRKKSVARVRLYPGTGNVTINGRDIDNYFGLETLKLIVNQPFGVTETVGKFDIVANVCGGGLTFSVSLLLLFKARAAIPLARKLSTWSFINEIRGDTTMAVPSNMSAGNW